MGAGLIGGPLYSPVGYLPGRRRTADEWKRAVECYQRALELGNRQPAIIRRVVQLLFERRRYAEAEQVIRNNPAAFADKQAVQPGDLLEIGPVTFASVSKAL